jgi:hypothetical protein
MTLEDRARQVSSREDFDIFLDAFLLEVHQNSAAWENASLDLYLEGLVRFAQSAGKYYQNMGEPFPPSPTWRLFAEFLLAGRVC